MRIASIHCIFDGVLWSSKRLGYYNVHVALVSGRRRSGKIWGKKWAAGQRKEFPDELYYIDEHSDEQSNASDMSSGRAQSISSKSSSLSIQTRHRAVPTMPILLWGRRSPSVG